MFSTDAQFLLTLHHAHVDELRAEADGARLARIVRRSGRNRARFAGRGRLAAIVSRGPADC